MECRDISCGYDGKSSSSRDDVNPDMMNFYCGKCGLKQYSEEVPLSESEKKKQVEVAKEDSSEQFAYFKGLNKPEQVKLLKARGIKKIPRFEDRRVDLLMKLYPEVI